MKLNQVCDECDGAGGYREFVASYGEPTATNFDSKTCPNCNGTGSVSTLKAIQQTIARWIYKIQHLSKEAQAEEVPF